MNSNEISISLAFQHPPFLSSFVLLFFSVLSISSIPRCHLDSYFYILDTIFFIVCCCFSFTLFKANQNIKSLMKKGSFRVGSSRVEGKFSDESNHKYSKIKKSDHPNFDDYDHDNQDQLLMDSTSPLKTSPICNSPWSFDRDTNNNNGVSTGDTESSDLSNGNMLMGSLVREEGHIYSLAASGDLLYTGSDSKNIRVWKNQREFSGFKSNSGLVKAIVISEDRIFSGHQDGKIRLWKVSSRNPSVHKRVGTLPTMKDFFKNSIKPSRYIDGRGNKNSVWVKHFDAISCLSLSEDKTILYSASWDKTFKVWRISNSKCLESINAHDDAVNSVVAGFDGLVFTGSADGSIKVWRRELQGKGTKHFFSQILLKQECAITALAVNPEATTIYGGSSDGLVNFWERNQQLGHGGVLRGHKLAILCLITAGSLVFSGSADMGICVWKRMRSDYHICLSVLSGHNGPVKCLAAEKDHESSSNDERWILYSGSLDKSVKIWRVSEKAPALAWNGRESAKPTMLPAAPTFSIRERSSDV